MRAVPINTFGELCLRLQRAGLGADVMGTGASSGGARAEGVHVAYAPDAVTRDDGDAIAGHVFWASRAGPESTAG